MKRDFYSDARALADDLRLQADRLVCWADQIEESSDAGFTSTEILMGLRFHLLGLLRDEGTWMPNDMRAAIEGLSDAIADALR